MFNIKGKRKGFTLIELIVVIAVLAILVTIGVPRYLGYTKDAQKATMQADTKIIEQAAYQYVLNNDGAWPYLEEEEVTEVNWTEANATLEDVIGPEGTAYKIDFKKIDPYIRSLSTKDYENAFFIVIGGEHEGEVYTVNLYPDSAGNWYTGLHKFDADTDAEAN